MVNQALFYEFFVRIVYFVDIAFLQIGCQRLLSLLLFVHSLKECRQSSCGSGECRSTSRGFPNGKIVWQSGIRLKKWQGIYTAGLLPCDNRRGSVPLQTEW